MIRVAVVEKVGFRREGYALLMQQFKHCEVVLQAKNEKELEFKMAKKPVDVVVYYCEATSENHLETIEAWQLQYPELKVLLIPPAFDHDAYTKAFENKSLGYLKMESTTRQLKKAILGLHRNGFYMDNRVLNHWKTGSDKQKQLKPNEKNIAINITEQELIILRDLIKAKNMHEIAEKHTITYSTVRTHRRNIIKKTGETSLISALAFLIINKVLTLKQLGLQCFLAFCFLFSSFDYTDDNNNNDDLERNNRYEWVKAA